MSGREEQEVVLRDVVGGKTAKPNAHHVRSIVGGRGVRKECAMWIPTAPNHRPAGGGSSDCAMSQCHPLGLLWLFCPFRFFTKA